MTDTIAPPGPNQAATSGCARHWRRQARHRPYPPRSWALAEPNQSKNEGIKARSNGPCGAASSEGLSVPQTGAIDDGRHPAHQIPRHLPAGRSRPPRRARPHPHGARLQLHGPAPHPRRPAHPRPMARSGTRSPAQRGQRHHPPHHPRDGAIPRHPQGQSPAPPSQEVHQSPCWTPSPPAETSTATSSATVNPLREARPTPPRSELAHDRQRRPVAEVARLARDLDRRHPGRRRLERRTGGRTHVRRRPTCPASSRSSIAVPPQNDVDLFAHDVGFVAHMEQGDRHRGLGRHGRRRHGHDPWRARHLPPHSGPTRFLHFVRPHAVAVATAAAILMAQRDHGNRAVRKNARLKYTIERMGLDAFRAGRPVPPRLHAWSPAAPQHLHRHRRPPRLVCRHGRHLAHLRPLRSRTGVSHDTAQRRLHVRPEGDRPASTSRHSSSSPPTRTS